MKKLINEIHRRSLWQVLGIFLAASWGVIEVVDLLTEQVGVPDWTPTTWPRPSSAGAWAWPRPATPCSW